MDKIRNRVLTRTETIIEPNKKLKIDLKVFIFMNRYFSTLSVYIFVPWSILNELLMVLVQSTN